MTSSINPQKYDFEITQFRIEDEPALIRSWKEAYPDLFIHKYPERWRWNMLANPFVPEEKRPLCWIAKNGKEVVAWTCAMAVPLDVAGCRIVGGHSVDTYTLQRYRGYGLGKKLQVLNQDAHTIFIAIDPSPINRQNKYKVGGHAGRALDTWLRIETTLDADLLYDSFRLLVVKYLGRVGDVLFSGFRRLGLARVLNSACSLALRMRQGRDVCKSSDNHTDLDFEQIITFGETVDLLWSRVVGNYSFAVSRDSAYLNWKYVCQPNIEYRKVLALRNDVPVGLVIYRFPKAVEQPVGIISECYCAGDDSALHAALIAYAIEEFDRQGVDMIKCGASTDNQRLALQSLGFGLVDIDVPVFHISPQTMGLDIKTILAKDWMLSLGDSDIDQIRPVQQPSFVEILKILLGKVPGSENLSQ